MDVVLELASFVVGAIMGVVLTGLVAACFYFKTEYEGLISRVNRKTFNTHYEQAALPAAGHRGRPKKYK